MYYAYIIQSLKNSRFYVGSTNNLRRRLLEHNGSKTKSLRGKGPFKIVYFEEFSTAIKSKKKELEIKSYKSGNAFKKLINFHR